MAKKKVQKIRPKKLIRHDVLDREEVIAGLLGRWQNIVGAFKYKARDLAMMMRGKSVNTRTDILREFFKDLQRKWLTVPEFLNLSAEAQNKFDELMEIIKEEK